MKYGFALLAVAAFFLASCGSAEVRNTRETEKISVVHSVEYSHKGTKSESRRGILAINGTAMPRCFSAVFAGGKMYVMKIRTQMWGSEGYFPDEETSAAAFFSGKVKAGAADLSRGWYEPASSEGFPSGWILVRWDGGSAAVDPVKVQDLITAKNLQPMNRKDLYMEKKFNK